MTTDTPTAYHTNTDRLRTELGLLTREEQLRFIAEILTDGTQVERRPARRANLAAALQLLRVAIMTR